MANATPRPLYPLERDPMHDANGWYQQGCTNPACHVTRAHKVCALAPNLCGSSVWNLLHVTLLAHVVFRWFPDFWKIRKRLRYYFVRCIFYFADYDWGKEYFTDSLKPRQPRNLPDTNRQFLNSLSLHSIDIWLQYLLFLLFSLYNITQFITRLCQSCLAWSLKMTTSS